MITNPYVIELETTSESNLFAWAASKVVMKSIKVILSHPSEFDSPRTIELYDTLCVGYDCYFDAVNNAPMTTRLALSPAIVNENGELIMEQSWKVTDLNAGSTEATTIQLNNPKVLKYWYEDEYGTELLKPKRNQNIELVIQTKDMVGMAINIDLSDDEIDYEYNGEVVENDLLENIQVTANTIRVKLKTIKQRS